MKLEKRGKRIVGTAARVPGDTMVTGPTPNTLVIVWFLSRFSLETQSVKAWYMDWTWVRV